VRNGRENSMPEKARMNVKCVALRRAWEFVRFFGASAGGKVVLAGVAGTTGRVSGRQK
jgi:hypothetical protein